MRPVSIRVAHRQTGETIAHEFCTSPIRLGRNPLNDLPLPYPFVSGWHAVIRFDDEEARFFDLGSTNGTLIDGRPVAVGETVDFDDPVTLQLGELDLTLTRLDRASAVQPRAPRRAARRGRQGSSDAGVIDTDGPVGGPAVAGTIGGNGSGTVSGTISGTLDPSQTAHVPMRRIHEAMADLRPAHEQLRQARLSFEQRLRARVDELPAHLRQTAEQFMRREFEGSEPGPAAGNASEAAASRALRSLAEALLPEATPPATAVELERFAGCLREVLTACAKGLVELQKGQEQFGQEMGVKAIKEFTPLHVAGSASETLQYLLDFRHGGPQRTQELVGVFADLMIHQMALLGGVAEGARALLDTLDPDAIEREVGGGLSHRKRWNGFVKRHRELSTEDRQWMEVVFGPEFSRAYAQVGGEQRPQPQPLPAEGQMHHG